MNYILKSYYILFTFYFLIFAKQANSQREDYQESYIFQTKDYKSEFIPSSHRGNPCFKYVFTRYSFSWPVEIRELQDLIEYMHGKDFAVQSDNTIRPIIGITFTGKLVLEDAYVGFAQDGVFSVGAGNLNNKIYHKRAKEFFNSNYYKSLL